MAIQLDPETYLREPQGPKEEYDTWLNDFNLEDRKGDISELLVANADVRLLYTQMVIHVVHFQDLLLKVHCFHSYYSNYPHRLYYIVLVMEGANQFVLRRANAIDQFVLKIADTSFHNLQVPSQVSHSNYWQRYFYKVFQLEQDKKRRADLMKRADDTEDQQLEWDDMG